ncbi:hypothetical protein WMY93_033364, partial [Mugilogobius chulae]
RASVCVCVCPRDCLSCLVYDIYIIKELSHCSRERDKRYFFIAMSFFNSRESACPVGTRSVWPDRPFPTDAVHAASEEARVQALHQLDVLTTNYVGEELGGPAETRVPTGPSLCTLCSGAGSTSALQT